MDPFTSAVVPATTFPAVTASYQIILLPVTEILETFGLAALQNDCASEPVGADGVVFTVTATARRDVDSQLPVVLHDFVCGKL